MLRLAAALFAKKPLPKRGRAAAPTRRTAKSPSRKPNRSASRTPRAAKASASRRTAAQSPPTQPPRSPPSAAPAMATTALTLPAANVSVEAPPYCLATAVSTIVVPPAANAVLEGMKQTLTPHVRRPNDGGVHHSPSDAAAAKEPISQMEEFYTSRKGPLFATAVIAGTNAVKQASQLIPFCHPMRIQKCSFTFRRRVIAGMSRTSALPHRVVLRKRTSPPPPPSRARGESSVLYCFCTVATDDTKMGVEMEALTGANVAALTLYDMLKGLPGAQEDGLSMGESFILARRGGKADFTKLLMSEAEGPKPTRETEDGEGVERVESNEETTPTAATPPVGESTPFAEREATHETVSSAATNTPERGNSAAAHPPTREAAPNDTPTEEQHSKNNTANTKQTVPETVKSNGTEENNVWWKSSAREKRQQQLHPRRRFEAKGPRGNARPKGGVVKKKKPNGGKAKSQKIAARGRKVSLNRPIRPGTTTNAAATPREKSKPSSAKPEENDEDDFDNPLGDTNDDDDDDDDNLTSNDTSTLSRPQRDGKVQEKKSQSEIEGSNSKRSNTREKAHNDTEEEDIDDSEERDTRDEEKLVEEEDEDVVVVQQKRKKKGKSQLAQQRPKQTNAHRSKGEKAVRVNHDSWDNQTEVLRDDDEAEQDDSDLQEYLEEAQEEDKDDVLRRDAEISRSNRQKSAKIVRPKRQSSRR